ncbi:MAG TPA: hypothetical protein OIM03_09985 [Veillonellaceae bacterium]|nr:hypothetical protein [Veillonellaceae bacterium]
MIERTVDFNEYYRAVVSDINELKEQYPFTKRILLPTKSASPIELDITAVRADVINQTGANEVDFLGRYSRRLHVIIPYDYHKKGCLVYGGKWIDRKKIPDKDQHFNGVSQDGSLLLCVGVPESFSQFKNVILECVKTADNMLTAYEKYQCGQSESLELISYAHGERGINEYRKEKKRHTT